MPNFSIILIAGASAAAIVIVVLICRWYRAREPLELSQPKVTRAEYINIRLTRWDLAFKALTAALAVGTAMWTVGAFFADRKAEREKPRRDLMLQTYTGALNAIAKYRKAYAAPGITQASLDHEKDVFEVSYNGAIRLVWSKPVKALLDQIDTDIANARIENGRRVPDVDSQLQPLVQQLDTAVVTDIKSPELPSPAS